MIFIVLVTSQLINGPAEKSIGEAETMNVIPDCSTAVPESSEEKQNMSSVPEPVEPPQNKSIPTAASTSTVAFDELGGLFPGDMWFFIELILFFIPFSVVLF